MFFVDDQNVNVMRRVHLCQAWAGCHKVWLKVFTEMHGQHFASNDDRAMSNKIKASSIDANRL